VIDREIPLMPSNLLLLDDRRVELEIWLASLERLARRLVEPSNPSDPALKGGGRN
jgi:hypothetical protein